MIEKFNTKNNPTSYNLLIFLIMLFLINLLVFKIEIGMFVFTGMALLVTALINPRSVYFLLISFFSIEGFSILENVSYPKVIAIILIIGLAMKIAVTKEIIPKDNLYKYISLFLIGNIISFAFSTDLSVSLKTYITYISLFCLYIITRYFLRSIKDIHSAMNYLIFSTLILFIVVSMFNLSVDDDTRFRISGGMSDSNEYASYILILLPLALYKVMGSAGISRAINWICFTGLFSLLIFTFSRGGMLGLLGASAVLIYYYSFRRTGQMLLFIIIAGCILYFFVPEEFWLRASTITNPKLEDGSSISYRIDSYKAAWKMFLDYPLAGVGLYNFRFNSAAYGVTGGRAVHNMYLEILTGGGLLVFIPFCLILINCWQKMRINKDYDKSILDLIICLKSSFVSMLITSFFISAGHNKIMWFLLALISSSYYIVNNQVKVKKI